MKSILTILAVLFSATLVHAEEGRRPNILFILADDQAPEDFGFYNPKSTLDSPNIDRLAAEGMVFDSAYHMGSFSGAVCTPSRHMIMSGRTVWRLPIGPGADKCPPNLQKNTIGAVFNRAGYATMRTCKLGNSYPAANRQFSVVHDATKRGGTAETGSAWHGDRVLDFLKSRAAEQDSRPFFIYLGFSHPHDVRDGTPELLAKYGATNHTDRGSPPPAHPKQPPLPPNWLPAHPFDNSHLDVRDEEQVSGVWKRRDPATIRNEIGRDFACAENIDIQVGRVLARLEEMGELDNTYIIYTADHGMAIGRHGLQGKQNLYEHTWRVPMIVKGPGIKPGSRAQGNIYLGDLLATFCELTGVPVPETNESTSFRPVLLGDRDTVRDTLYGVYAGGEKPGIRAIRKGDWKLIEYKNAKSGSRETQLFNLAENPLELIAEHHDPAVISLTGTKPEPGQTNLAADPDHAAKLAEMRALLLEQMRLHDDPWRFDNPTDDGTAQLKANQPNALTSRQAPPGKPYVYKTSGGQERQLEIFLPPNHDPETTKVPGIILFHGGGWSGGTLAQFREACAYFASRGLVCATAEYQMLSKANRAKLPAGESFKRVCVTDAKTAIRWFKLNADQLGVDPNRIITGGGSAGGHISALATMNPGLNDPADPEEIDTSVVAYLWFNPAFSPDDANDSEIDILQHLGADLPPAIVFFGENDRWLPGWTKAYEKWKSLKTDVIDLRIAPGESHGFFNQPVWRTVTLIAADEFLVRQKLLTGKPTLTMPASGENLVTAP